MQRILPKYLFIVLAPLVGITSFAQGDIEDQLIGVVENWNPVYKPVIGIGGCAFNFLGDVRDPNLTVFNGSLGYKVNVTTFVDNNHYIRANFFIAGGSLKGDESLNKDRTRNMNFRSDILLFGLNLNYDFDNFYKTYRKVHPFVSVGFEMMTFDSKIDSFSAANVRYNYWPDGSVRDLPYRSPQANIITRDFKYETDLRRTDWGQGNYSQYAFAVPVDVGLDYWLSDRLMFRVATSYHFVFNDNIDHVSYKNTSGIIGDKRNDDFICSYISMHLDLFSSEKTLEWNRMFVELEFDQTLTGDEDGDGWQDVIDQCPGTPFGVETDSSGCPLDNDYDGIPNYRDDQLNSRLGAMVDDRGVEMTEDEVIASLDMSKAVPRKDISIYLKSTSDRAGYKRFSSKEIPPEFSSVDRDSDNYISFDEMMKAIDDFFEFDSELSTEDIYKLNDFFFSQ